MTDWINNYIAAHHRTIDTLSVDMIAEMIETLRDAHSGDRQIFVCGNGGSAANASHFATDLGKSASDKVGRPFRVLSRSAIEG